ncbi:PRC-barrel domain-containing protein [archaeon]|nr:PRC-barrel domain-containing protein [archaeon]
MTLKLKNISEAVGLQVFTDTGEYFGEIEEAILTLNKISGWRVKASRGSALSKSLGGGAKGVVVPHALVKSISDVMIVSRAAMPAFEEMEQE